MLLQNVRARKNHRQGMGNVGWNCYVHKQGSDFITIIHERKMNSEDNKRVSYILILVHSFVALIISNLENSSNRGFSCS